MKRHTHTPLTAQDGFSLVEVMVVTMLLGIILSAAYMAINMVTTVSDGIMARDQAQNQGQLTVEKMVRELRMVHQTSDGIRFLHMTPKQVSFYADVDGDGMLDCVTYTVANGALTRAVAHSGKVNPDSSEFGPDSAPVKLADADSSVATVFQYWTGGSDGDAPQLVGAQTAQASVAAVKISLTAKAASGATLVAVAIPTTTVHVRANDTE